LFHGEHEIAAVGPNGEAQLILAEAEDCFLSVFRIGEFEDGVGGENGASLAEREMKLLGEVVQGDLVRAANGGGKLIGFVTGQWIP
jgi:hypothetical protein